MGFATMTVKQNMHKVELMDKQMDCQMGQQTHEVSGPLGQSLFEVKCWKVNQTTLKRHKITTEGHKRPESDTN